MQMLKHLHQHGSNIIPILGKSCGDGSDGEVFEIINDPSKVIKISIMYDLNFNNDLNIKYSELTKILYELVTDSPLVYAHVYEYEKIALFKRDCLVGDPANNRFEKQDCLLHYHVLEKCFKLSEDEKKVFHTIVSHEDYGIIKKFSSENLKEILFGLSRGLDFDEKRVIFFYESLLTCRIKHNDLHQRNIMKDSFGNFKLIDLDRLEII